METENKSSAQATFDPIFGQKPWRVRLGWGSFVTLDFGSRVKRDHHYHGTWSLWIRYCDWSIESNKRKIVSSEDSRNLIQISLRNLEKYQFTGIKVGEGRTDFVFDNDFRIVCIPYPDQAADEDVWTFFLPDRIVSLAASNKLRTRQLESIE